MPTLTPLVIKIGGNDLDNPPFITELVQWVAACTQPLVIVHGGGRAVAQLQTRLGLTPQMVNGVRQTDSETLTAVIMGLAGQINTQLVAALQAGGVNAVGLSGVDGGLLQVQKKADPHVDLGWVGEVTTVQPELLHNLLASGFTPVVAPISLGPNGQPYNVNADHAASALAAALVAPELYFVSNVPGVLHHKQVQPHLTAPQVAEWIDTGIITDGMIPKVQAALAAVHAGVPAARIVNLSGLPHGGTQISAS